MSSIRLSHNQRRSLRQQMKKSQSSHFYKRVFGLLALDKGHTIVEVARMLDVDRKSVYRWVQRYLQNSHPSALATCQGQGRPKLFSQQLCKMIKAKLQHSPQDYGYTAANWTVPLLCEYILDNSHMRVSPHTMRRQLYEWGYVWKRYRYVLPPDPEREKKTLYPALYQDVAWRPCGVGNG